MFSTLKITDIWNRKRVAILAIISLLPPAVLFFIIASYWVNVPVGDQWDISIIFDKYYSQTLGFSDLIGQANESRLLFPRLIILGFGLMTGWDVRIEMCITFVLACSISLNLFVLLHRIEDISISSKLVLMIILNLLLFSPVQWANWLWGLQMIVFIPPLMLTTGLIINTSNISMRKKVAYNSALSIISTFSYANGMLVWLLLLPVNIFFTKRSIDRRDIHYILSYIAVAVLTIGFYFMDYVKPVHHPSFLYAFSHPVAAILYFLNWIGAPFVPDNPFASAIPSWVPGLRLATGLLIFSIFLLSTYCLLLRYKSNQLSNFYPWSMIGLYSIISGAITTLGRLGMGISQGASHRYTSFSIFLPISVVVLVYLIHGCHLPHKLKVTSKNIVVTGVALLFWGTLYAHTYQTSIKTIKFSNMCLENGKLALQFYKIFQDNTKLLHIYPHSPDHLIDRFGKLAAIGLLDFKPVDPDILKLFKNPTKTGNSSCGSLEQCRLITPNALLVTGWACHREKVIPARNVILVYTEKNGDSNPFGILRVTSKRPDIATLFKSSAMLNSGFADIIKISRLPSENLIISAWIVDIDTDIAHQLANIYHYRSYK